LDRNDDRHRRAATRTRGAAPRRGSLSNRFVSAVSADGAGLQFDATYEPVQHDLKIGGDWYDVVHLVDGRILVLIGDVVGNGLEAARHPVTTSLF